MINPRAWCGYLLPHWKVGTTMGLNLQPIIHDDIQVDYRRGLSVLYRADLIITVVCCASWIWMLFIYKQICITWSSLVWAYEQLKNACIKRMWKGSAALLFFQLNCTWESSTWDTVAWLWLKGRSSVTFNTSSQPHVCACGADTQYADSFQIILW